MGLFFVGGCGKVPFGRDRCFYCNDPIGIAPDPRQTKEALVQIYGARAWDWRGVFAVHTWIALKPRGAPRYTVLQVTGWWPPPLKVSQVLRPDRRWHGADPEILYELRGEPAEAAIPKIQEVAQEYPQEYKVWPGPNSNTFTAYVIREVPELKADLPPTAVGKDFLLNGSWVGLTPSGSGVQVSLKGLLGLMVGIEEGMEVNLLGLSLGIDLKPLALKLPLVGRVGMPQGGTLSQPEPVEAARQPDSRPAESLAEGPPFS
jgi:hypothetical protein